MIKREDGKVIMECDTCCDAEFVRPRDIDWSDFIAQAKADGWIIEKVGRDFVHGCARCGT